MITFYIIASLKFIYYGCILGRLDGGGIASVSNWLERLLIMSCFVLATAPSAGIWSLASFFGVVGIGTGHGQYFPEVKIKPLENERTDFIVEKFFGPDPRAAIEFIPWRGESFPNMPEDIKQRLQNSVEEYGTAKLRRRCNFGMFITGTLVGLPSFVLLAILAKSYACFFLLTGVIKSFSYIIGWKFFKSNVPAEYINGGGRNVICLIEILIQFSA